METNKDTCIPFAGKV